MFYNVFCVYVFILVYGVVFKVYFSYNTLSIINWTSNVPETLITERTFFPFTNIIISPHLGTFYFYFVCSWLQGRWRQYVHPFGIVHFIGLTHFTAKWRLVETSKRSWHLFLSFKGRRINNLVLWASKPKEFLEVKWKSYKIKSRTV